MMKNILQKMKKVLKQFNLKKFSKKTIALIVAGIVFFTAVIYTIAKGIDYKSLKADITGVSGNYTNTFKDYSEYTNYSGLNSSSVILSEDTSFVVRVYDQTYDSSKIKLDENKSVDVNVTKALPPNVQKKVELLELHG